MRPFLSPGDMVTLRSRQDYRPGDIVFAMTRPDRKPVLHYVASAEIGGYTLMGAANLVQTEYCRAEDVAGAVELPHISRRSVLLWHRLLPLRRYLLWIYRKFSV